MVNGRDDFGISRKKGEGIPVKLIVYPGEGHFLAPQHRTDYLAALTDW